MAGRTSYNKRAYDKDYVGYHNYIEGNAVKKEQIVEVPQRTERTYVDHQRVRTSKQAYRNREKALHMSLSYAIVLAVCSVAILLVCAKYLSLRDEVAGKSQAIAAMEMKTDSLRAQNDSLDYTINGYKDFDYIAKIATEELGMIRAGQAQISFYTSSESEYMKQYKDIPVD